MLGRCLLRDDRNISPFKDFAFFLHVWGSDLFKMSHSVSVLLVMLQIDVQDGLTGILSLVWVIWFKSRFIYKACLKRKHKSNQTLTLTFVWSQFELRTLLFLLLNKEKITITVYSYKGAVWLVHGYKPKQQITHTEWQLPQNQHMVVKVTNTFTCIIVVTMHVAHFNQSTLFCKWIQWSCCVVMRMSCLLIICIESVSALS